MIFLNIDYDYFFDSQEDVLLNKNKKRWANPINFFSNINLKLIKQRYCFLDHHQALYHWDQINCSNIHCIHIDAHHDLYSDEIDDWNIPNQSRGEFIGVGNYLFRALLEGKINKITWIIPDWLSKDSAFNDLKKYIGSSLIKNIKIMYYNEMIEIFDDIFLTISISPEWIPDPEREIFDIIKFLKNFNFDTKSIDFVCDELKNRYNIKDFNHNALRYRFKFPYERNNNV